MPTRIVYRDQAVWEREYILIEVPDSVPEEDVEEFVFETIYADDYIPTYLREPEIQDSVEGIDTIIEINHLELL